MEDFGPHHEIKMGKRQKEELAKTCSRFLDGEHIMRLRRDLRRQHGLPAAPDAALAGPAKAGRAARRGAAAAPGGSRELLANHFARLVRVRVPKAALGGVRLGNEAAVAKRVVVLDPGAAPLEAGDVLQRLGEEPLPWQTAAAPLLAGLRDAGAPWTEWYLWRPTPDAAFDAAEVAVALEPTLRVDLAKLDMLPDTPVPGLSGLPVALDVVDAKRGVVDDDDWLRSGDVLVGLDQRRATGVCFRANFARRCEEIALGRPRRRAARERRRRGRDARARAARRPRARRHRAPRAGAVGPVLDPRQVRPGAVQGPVRGAPRGARGGGAAGRARTGALRPAAAAAALRAPVLLGRDVRGFVCVCFVCEDFCAAGCISTTGTRRGQVAARGSSGRFSSDGQAHL